MPINENVSQPEAKIKACIVAWSVYKSDARVRKYAEALVALNYMVDVICLSPFYRRDFPHQYCLNGVNVHEIGSRTQESGLSSYTLPLLKFWLRSFFYISKLAFKNRYSIVHVNSLPDFEVFASIVPKLLGAKIILDIHDPVPDLYLAKYPSSNKRIIYKILCYVEKICTRYSDHVITVTDYWRKVIGSRSKIPIGKISVILNLPDIRLFSQLKYPRHERVDGKFNILYPGTLNKHCGLEVVICAMKLARPKVSSLKLNIYGKGSQSEIIEFLIKDLGLSECVSLNDPVPWDSVPLLMAQADAGIALLSGVDLYSQQALNVKIFEFLAMGVPVIATRTKSTEYYLGGDVIMLSEPNDPEDVARAIIELHSNDKKRSELSNKGLKYIQTHNWETEALRYYEIISRMISTASRYD